MVCTAGANNAVLVAFDTDTKLAARRQAIGQKRYRHLSLIRLSCRETAVARRSTEALDLIKAEWTRGVGDPKRRLFVEIGDGFIKTYRCGVSTGHL